MKKILNRIFLVAYTATFVALCYCTYLFFFAPSYESIEITPQSIDMQNKATITTTDEVPPHLAAMENGEQYTENVIGWIEIPGIHINDPLIQYIDNDKYLKYTEYDTQSVWGAYFLNCENSVAGNNLDKVSTIFGHSNGGIPYPKFGYLKLLAEPQNAQRYRTIVVWFGNVKTTWRIFAVGDYPVENNYIVTNPDDSTFAWQIEQMKSYSIHQYGVDVSEDDQILILSTCTSSTQLDTRFIVCAKLVLVEESTIPEGENYGQQNK